MKVLKLFGITSCDSCKAAQRWLKEHDIEYQFHDLRKDGLEVQMLERWSDNLGWEKLLNKRSLTWRRIPEMDRDNLTKGRAIALMMDNSTLGKRTVLERGKFIGVGFSADGYARVFKREAG